MASQAGVQPATLRLTDGHTSVIFLGITWRVIRKLNPSSRTDNATCCRNTYDPYFSLGYCNRIELLSLPSQGSVVATLLTAPYGGRGRSRNDTSLALLTVFKTAATAHWLALPLLKNWSA